MSKKWVSLKDFVLLSADEQHVIRCQIVYHSFAEDRALLAPIWIERVLLRGLVFWFDASQRVWARILRRWGAHPYELRKPNMTRHEPSYQEGRRRGQEEMDKKLV